MCYCTYGYPGHGYSLSLNYAAGNKLQVTTLGIADMPSDTAVVEPDLWQHVAVVHKKSVSITYFVNGKEIDSRPYTNGIISVDTRKFLYIGAEWDGNLAFTGTIDRVRISNAALTANQLDSDAKNPATAPQSALRIVGIKPDLSGGNITLTWEGGSPQFQVEKAATITGTFQSVGAAQSALVFTDTGALKAAAQSYYRIRQVSSTPEPAACSIADVPAGFVNTAMTNQTGTFQVEFEATPSEAPIDSVMALSSGAGGAFTSFACLARFWETESIIQARNGGDYSADNVIPYEANVKYKFRMDVNIPAHTYSVYVTSAGGAEQTVGKDFAFRTDQSTVTNLDNWAVIVDSTSGTGTNTVCNFKLVP